MRDAVLVWVYAMAILSVCLPACLPACLSVCVTRILCIKIAKHFVEILLLPDSPIILVFRNRCLTLTASLLTGVPNTRDEKIGRFFTNKSAYLGNGVRYDHSCPGIQIGNHT